MATARSTPRSLHPAAWWLWAALLAAAAARTTNPLVLALTIAVAGWVVSSRRSTAPWARSFGTFLRLGAFIICFRVVLQVLFGVRVPGTTLVTLPSVDLPEWAAGFTLGGEVTLEAVAQAAVEGLRLAAILACFGAANSLASPFRLLRCLPAVLYEAGVAVTVALSITPQLSIEAGRVREARRLRGRPTSGAAGVRGIALPVLEGALERSVALAASMDTRGYGRRADMRPGARRAVTLVTAGGLAAVAIGTYGLLDAGAPAALGFPLLAIGCLALASTLFVRGRDATRTRYRPDPWVTAEWTTAAAGALALAGVLATATVDPASLTFSASPLTAPELPPLATLGLLCGAAPAWLTPLPPDRAAAVPDPAPPAAVPA